MELLVLGSGEVNSLSNYSGYLMDRTILIDCPPGATKQLLRTGIDSCSITDVVLTHFHADHFFDLPFLFIARFRKAEKPLKIHCPSEGTLIIPQVLKMAYPDIPLSTVPFEIDCDDAFYCEGYSFTRFEVSHGLKKQCYAYVAEKDGLRIAFSGDTAYCSILDKIADYCTCFICECTVESGSTKHMGIDSLTKLSTDHPACKFYATHMTDYTREKLQIINSNRIGILTDGQIITLI